MLIYSVNEFKSYLIIYRASHHIESWDVSILLCSVDELGGGGGGHLPWHHDMTPSGASWWCCGIVLCPQLGLQGMGAELTWPQWHVGIIMI